MMAPAQGVDNLTVIIDFNKWQATGRSNEVMALQPLAAKWEAFGWNAREVDGHDHAALLKAIGWAYKKDGKPTAIIAHTTKGKGVSFMEDDNNWHYRAPTEEEVVLAHKELELP
jgi:transketolase